MLTQLNRLSIDADGRYATAAELQFLKNYLQTVNQRITTYEKIRDTEQEIVTELRDTVQPALPDVFRDASEQYLAFCHRDRSTAVRCMAAAMLIDDLDILRQGVLCWVRTIINSTVGYGRSAQVNYKIISEVIAKRLSPEEMKLMRPAIDLAKSILTDSLA